MSKLPTDLKILKCIYKMYKDEFNNYTKEHPTRDSKIYVPIDIRNIADKLKTDSDILFGRLYYHLDNKYRYEQSDGSKVHLFAFKVGNDMHCIHYPYLAAIVSEKNTDWKRSIWSLTISLISIGIALAALIYNIYGATGAPTVP